MTKSLDYNRFGGFFVGGIQMAKREITVDMEAAAEQIIGKLVGFNVADAKAILKIVTEQLQERAVIKEAN